MCTRLKKQDRRKGLIHALVLNSADGVSKEIDEWESVRDIATSDYKTDCIWVHLNLDNSEAEEWFNTHTYNVFEGIFGLRNRCSYRIIDGVKLFILVGAVNPPRPFVEIELIRKFRKLPYMRNPETYQKFISTLYNHQLHFLYIVWDRSSNFLLTGEKFDYTYRLFDDPTYSSEKDLSRTLLHGVSSLREEILGGFGPKEVDSCFFELLSRLTSNVHDTMVEFEHVLSGVEDHLFDAKPDTLLRLIASLRTHVTRIYKKVVPLRETLSAMRDDSTVENFLNVRNLDGRINRLKDAVGDIQNIWQRITNIRDAVAGKVTVSLTIYTLLLTIIATITLPLTVIASLFGANVVGTHEFARGVSNWIERLFSFYTNELGSLSVVLGILGMAMVGVLWYWWSRVSEHLITTKEYQIRAEEGGD